MIDDGDLGELRKYLLTHPGLTPRSQIALQNLFDELQERRNESKRQWLVCEHGGAELRCCTSCLEGRYISAVTDMKGEVRTLQKAVQDLIEWTPEWVDTREYNKKRSEADRQWPLATEAHSYVLFGKDTARTYLALIHRLASASGVDRDAVLRDKCDEIQNQLDLAAECGRRRAERKRGKASGK